MTHYNRKTWVLFALTILGTIALLLRWTMIDNPSGSALLAQKYSMAQTPKKVNVDSGWIAQLKASPSYRKIKSTHTFTFLIWNLFLAWIPFIAAWLFSRAVPRGRPWIWSLSLLSIWLVFLPNAPYIITDLLHLKWRHPIPHWYDLMLLFIFAYTGLALGLASVFKVQQTIAAVTSKKWGWIIAMGSLGLTGIGIYLGRVLRYNSWDLLHRPTDIIASAWNAIYQPLENPGAGMGWMLSIFLCLIYIWEYGGALSRAPQPN